VERSPQDPPPTVPISPTGPDPASVPDPMPADLRDTRDADEAFEDSDPMRGDAPTG
jgi:hypothetical protein